MIKVCQNHSNKPANKSCSKCGCGLCKWCSFKNREKKLCDLCTTSRGNSFEFK